MFWRRKTPDQLLEHSRKKIDYLTDKLIIEKLKAIHYSKLVEAYKRNV
jgi:hypothetical protein